MSEELLEILKRVENNLEHRYPENIRDFEILKQAVIKLNTIKEGNPKKALDCLSCLGNFIDGHCTETTAEDDVHLIECFDAIEQYLLKAQDIEKENAYIEKIKTMMKQKDCALRYIESENCFAVKTILSDGWYKLTPEFVDNNVKEEIKPLPLIQKNVRLREENTKYKTTLENLEYENKILIKENVRNAKITERQHNAFNIIKEKRVNIEYLMKSKTAEEYNSYLYFKGIDNAEFYKLTQEKFVLLKEVFA